MLQNARVAAFTVSKSLRENQKVGKTTPPPSPPPTQIRVKNKCVTDFQEKANVLTLFLAKQCSPIPSSNVLSAKVSYMTKDRIKTICFGKSDVINLIKALDVSKAHGHDGI